MLLARFLVTGLIEHLVTPETLEALLLQPDISGNTPLMMAIDFGKVSMVSDILIFLTAQKHRENMLKDIIEHRNASDQNIFHLTIVNPLCDKLIKVLLEYSHFGDARSIYEPDKFGNSPLTYLAGRYMTEPFAVGLMKLSLSRRKRLIFATNNAGKNCVTIIKTNDRDKAFFLDSVLCGNNVVSFGELGSETAKPYEAPNVSTTFYHSKNQSTLYNFNFLESEYDERIWVVLRYALNEYDVTFSVSLSNQAGCQSTAISCNSNSQQPIEQTRSNSIATSQVSDRTTDRC